MAILEHRVVLYQYDTETIASIFDSQNVEYTFEVKPSMTFEEIIAKSKEALPAYEIRQKEMELQLQAEQRAKTEAVEAKAQAEAEKTKAVMAKTMAETRADDLAIQVQRANDRLALALTGGLVPEAKTDLIRQFPVWQEGISVDTGEAYRIADILYRAKREHVTSKDNGPESAQAADYWEGGTIEPKTPAASPGFKYPKGTEQEYMGARYYATVDTNDGPDKGYPTWDLVDNKP